MRKYLSQSTLQNRVNNIAYQAGKRVNNHRLTLFERELFIKWVLNLDKCGLPL